MGVRAVRAVQGMVESGFLSVPFYDSAGWRRMTDLSLPPNGPLTEEKGTAMVRNLAHHSLSGNYWFACHDWEGGDVWYPGFTTCGTFMLLGVSFPTRTSCEEFIEFKILNAAEEIGPPRYKDYRSTLYGTTEVYARDDQWVSWIRQL